eukprot:11159969-Lingulodinium_polyedra.AAC.1
MSMNMSFRWAPFLDSAAAWAIRSFTASSGGIAANSPSRSPMEDLGRKSFATKRLRWTPNPFSTSTHLTLIGALPLIFQQSSMSTTS